MKLALHHLYIVFSHLGGFGLLSLGIVDSSFLFIPLGNDLLVIAMSAQKHVLMPYYAVMAAAGSVLGCLTVDLVCRKGGEKELEKRVSKKRLNYVKKQLEKDAPWALAFASLMPPPFPFTPFVIVSSALQYPRRKLLGVIGAARLVRFSIEGVLAILVGRRLLRAATSPAFEYAIGILIVICIAGSAISVYRWVSQSKGSARKVRK